MSDIRQTGNVAHGDVVGGNKIDKSTKVYNFAPSDTTALSTLYSQFKNDLKENAQYKETIDRFDYYTTPFKGDVIGLETKLRNGKFDNIVEYAESAKELFHKQLYKNQFYESAQKINCFFLAMVQSYFMSHIYPHIIEGVSEADALALVQEKVVDPILEKLGENVLDLIAVDIHGMLYFLTGNCHVKWSK